MLNQSTLLALLLNSAPNSPPEIAAPDFADQIDSVDVTVSSSDVLVVAFNDTGAAIGSLSVWVDDDVTWLAADYADGYSLIGIDQQTGDVVYDESTLPSDIAAERSDSITEAIAFDPQAKGEWFWCGVTVGTAVSVCAGAAASGGLLLVGCAAASAAATCKCITAWASNKGLEKCAE